MEDNPQMSRKYPNCVLHRSPGASYPSKRFHAQPSFDSILYPSIVQSVDRYGNADNWVQNVIRDAERIKSGAMDAIIKGVCDIFSAYTQASNIAASLEKEIGKLVDQREVSDELTEVYGQMVRQYETTDFHVSLRHHEKPGDRRDRGSPWDIIRCPGGRCTGFVDFASNGGTEGTCCACSTVVCKTCHREIATGHECTPGDVQSVSTIKDDSKPCPLCLSPIFKVSGCPHMHCSACRYDFDWVTLKPLTKEETTNTMAHELQMSTVRNMVDPALRLVQQSLDDDVDAVRLVEGLRVWVNTAIRRRKKPRSVYNTFEADPRHPVLERIRAGDDTPSLALAVVTLLCASIAIELYTVDSYKKGADIERLKYLSNIQCTRTTYKNFLYKHEIRMRMIQKHHIPKLCQLIRGIVATTGAVECDSDFMHCLKEVSVAVKF